MGFSCRVLCLSLDDAGEVECREPREYCGTSKRATWQRSGDDTVLGEDGYDVVGGGDGRDVVNGGAGDDKVYGGSGNDHLLGEAGRDRLYGEQGRDLLEGGAGKDLVSGGRNADLEFQATAPATVVAAWYVAFGPVGHSVR